MGTFKQTAFPGNSLKKEREKRVALTGNLRPKEEEKRVVNRLPFRRIASEEGEEEGWKQTATEGGGEECRKTDFIRFRRRGITFFAYYLLFEGTITSFIKDKNA